jgi:hypothetical protein
VRWKEVVARLHAALLQSDLGHVVVRKVGRKLVQAPDAGAVRNGLNIEGEDRLNQERLPW